jgi:hypothetical protein
MRVLGVLTSIVGIVFILLGVVLGVRSIPDIQRYLKIRQM